MENRILGALARLDYFLMNSLVQGQSGTTQETSRNVFSTSQRTKEDDSQSNPLPEAAIFNNQTTQNTGPEDGHEVVAAATEQILYRHDMVKGATEQNLYRHGTVKGATEKIRKRHHMVTGATEQIGIATTW